MSSLFSSVRALTQMFDGKLQQFVSDIETVHMVWLEEIQQEATRMFSSEFTTEPELMPKTPSQKRSTRRKRVSLGYQEQNSTKRRFSKGKRSKLRQSSVQTLNLIAEDESIPEASTSEVTEQPKRSTRRNKQTQPDASVDTEQPSPCGSRAGCNADLNKQLEAAGVGEEPSKTETKVDASRADPTGAVQTPPKIPVPGIRVRISSEDYCAAQMAKEPESSPGRTASKIAIASTTTSSRSAVRHSLKLRHSLAGLRHSMTQESLRRASRRSLLKKMSGVGNSTFISAVSDDSCQEGEEAEENGDVMVSVERLDTKAGAAESEAAPEARVSSDKRITRSMAVNSPSVLPTPAISSKLKATASDLGSDDDTEKPSSESSQRTRQSVKRKVPDLSEESPLKKQSPPKKSSSLIRPHMRSFLHTVQRNQMLMMNPCSSGRAAVKSFIKHTTPLKLDLKLRERMKLEALKKKQEQEQQTMKKMEEEKKKKQEELKRKRDERLRRVIEARMKEEQKGEEKKKRIEQKMTQIEEKNDKMRLERNADDKVKKKAVTKRQEELEQRRKLDEEARRRKLQQAEEEKRQQELLVKRKAEEEELRARKMAEAQRALELKQERERELQRERHAAAEREREERAKAIALHREVERAAREKERRELEERIKRLEEKKREEQQRVAKEREAARQKEAKELQMSSQSVMNVTREVEKSIMQTPVRTGAGLNVTVEVEQSPQSYKITPKGGCKPVIIKPPDDYGMDQNSSDSTDDESAPKKSVPSWATGQNLQQAIMKQYFSPPDLDAYFGPIEPPKLEKIFCKSKPRYFKRTSSAVWHSPPRRENHF